MQSLQYLFKYQFLIFCKKGRKDIHIMKRNHIKTRREADTNARDSVSVSLYKVYLFLFSKLYDIEYALTVNSLDVIKRHV
jgi:hypothetical protein